jgi:hypothetical protein
MIQLSKSDYVAYKGCPKLIWFAQQSAILGRSTPVATEKTEDDIETLHHKRVGKQVGSLARSYFGKYSLVKWNEDFDQMCSETKRLMDAGTEVIAEASFKWQNLSCQADILRKIGKNTWELTEVKSATEVKDEYYDDVAFQYYVLTSAGLKIKRVNLLHINNQYIRSGDLDVQEMFTLEDLTDSVLEMQDDVKATVKTLVDAAKSDEASAVPMGEGCIGCEHHEDCGIHLPSPNVYDIRGLWASKKWALYQKGLVSFKALLDNHAPLSDKYLLQVETEAKNLPPTINKAGIKSFLDTLTFPIYFLDFETFDAVIPEWDGIHPYQKLTCQYSLHIMDKIDGRLVHKEFLADEKADPRRACAERLCEDIPMDVCILAYHSSFERGRIEELARTFPDLEAHLSNMAANIYDLEIPFRKRDYYRKEFYGSSSIKYVLPALFPNNDELDYHKLDGVHNGGEAMNLFPELKYMEPAQVAEYRKNLLAYCRLDTLAMVRVLQYLFILVEGNPESILGIKEDSQSFI